MAERYYQKFSITGVANTTTPDAGIQSTETEKRKIVGVHISVSN